MIVALTGNIGSGKSTAAKILSKLGGYIIDADLLAREVVEPGTPGLKSVIAHFGEEFLESDGRLNRKKLGDLIFKNLTKKEELEKILHPLIREKFLVNLKKAVDLGNNIIVYVIPLLFETKNPCKEFDKIILIAASRENSIKRIMLRDSLSRKDAEARYDSQINISEKVKLADHVIWNDKNESNLEEELKKWLSSLN